MLTAISAAVIAAVASLAGVTLGALVEPLKLNAARRAKLRQERADRCAGFIEAAVRARQHIVDLNVTHRRRELAEDAIEGDAEREVAYEEAYYTARAQMRSFYGLLVMSGPDELVEQAKVLRRKEMELHEMRRELDADRKFDQRYLPAAVIRATGDFDRAIEEFALVARKHTS
ncbi:hypothetical protein [Amycolatopsis tolypomycina]|uniref:Uncharacterized protein n=1 Tax=Amycolatopsis tolypomycina TaxID=208445 RepID=A0A1H5BZ21_9PSEU|nr:hypothetical protein [Amycolatopsis tolypomycina]SED59354.1 hypothetical protein SAMN04489727_8504 [Amycolatopsis tolypomycina]